MPRTELVEDLVQEIMLAAWQALPGFRGDSRLRTWILGIARHKVEDHYRKCLRNLELSDDEEAIDEQVLPIPSKEIESVEQKEQVGRTLAALPEAYAVALIWRYRDEKSVREMAQLSGKTEKAMERLLARARENFRRRWHDA